MCNPIFEIYYPQWNSTTEQYEYQTIDLLQSYAGTHTNSFSQNIQQLKQGGVFQDSTLYPGRDLAFSVLANGVETVDLKMSGKQTKIINQLTKFLRGARKAALDYWQFRNQSLMPVYIKVKTADEPNPRYAAVVTLSFDELENIFQSPFFNYPSSVLDNLTLTIERTEWRANPPGTGECASMSTHFTGLYTAPVTPFGESFKGNFVTSAGTILGGGGITIRRSTDGGDSFSDIPVTFNSAKFFVQTDTGRIYAANDSDLYLLYSDNDGVSWSQTAVLANAAINSLHFGRFSKRIWVGISSGLYYSDDGGASWTFNAFTPYTVTETLAVIEITLDIILAAAGSGSSAILISGDGGATFKPITYYTPDTEKANVLYQLSDGRVVFGDTDGRIGVSNYFTSADDFKFVNIADTPSYPTGNILTIFEDSNGAVYLLDNITPEWYITYDFSDIVTLFSASSSGDFQISEYNGSIILTQSGVGTGLYLSDDSVANFGVSSGSCVLENIAIGNKNVLSAITNVKTYDDSTATYTDIYPNILPTALLPDPPEDDDIVYFITDTSIQDTGPFSAIAFNLDPPLLAVGTYTWEYWNGAWTTLTVVAPSAPLKTSGFHLVVFEVPSDWTTTTVDGVTGFIIRLYVTSPSSQISTPTQVDYNLYSVSKPFVDITNINGDLDCITKMSVRNVSDADGRGGSSPDLYSNRIVCGKRKLSRGSFFSAYLNASDEQNQINITVTAGTNVSVQTDVQAPTGRSYRYNPAGVEVMADRLTWDLGGILGLQYAGIYHAYARIHQTAGSVGDFDVQLKVVFGSGGLEFTTESVQPQTTTQFELLDFGTIGIPKFDTLTDTLQLILQASAASGTPNLDIFDLILIPVDEWAGDYSDGANVSGSEISQNESLEVNGLEPLDIPAVVKDASGAIKSEYEPSGNPLVLEPLENDTQRLWILQAQASTTGSSFSWIAKPEICSLVTIEKNEGYLAFRDN